MYKWNSYVFMIIWLWYWEILPIHSDRTRTWHSPVSLAKLITNPVLNSCGPFQPKKVCNFTHKQSKSPLVRKISNGSLFYCRCALLLHCKHSFNYYTLTNGKEIAVSLSLKQSRVIASCSIIILTCTTVPDKKRLLWHLILWIGTLLFCIIKHRWIKNRVVQ